MKSPTGLSCLIRAKVIAYGPLDQVKQVNHPLIESFSDAIPVRPNELPSVLEFFGLSAKKSCEGKLKWRLENDNQDSKIRLGLFILFATCVLVGTLIALTGGRFSRKEIFTLYGSRLQWWPGGGFGSEIQWRSNRPGRITQG